MESRNQKAIKGIAICLAILTYVGAVVYGDIMFLSVMQEAFPSGFLGTLAMVGAVMTAVSAITLPLALHWWFSPGLQFVWGIIFWGIDILALALNSILAYQIAMYSITGIDPVFGMWREVSPATPMLAVIGWGIAFMLDPSHKARHAQLELEGDLIDIHARQLREAAKSEDVYRRLMDGAIANADDVIAMLTARRPAPKLPASTDETVYTRQHEKQTRPLSLSFLRRSNNKPAETEDNGADPTTR